MAVLPSNQFMPRG